MGWERKKTERLQVSFRMRVDRKKFKTAKAAKRALEAAKDLYIRTGRSIEGVHIIVRWRNPDNWNPRHFEWKTSDDADQSLYGAWQTLGQRGAFAAWSARPVAMPVERKRFRPPKRKKIKRTRSTTLKQYWRAIKNLRRRHPKWTLKRARQAYAKRKK